MCHFPYFRRRKRDLNEGFGYGYNDKKCFFFSPITDRTKKTEKNLKKQSLICEILNGGPYEKTNFFIEISSPSAFI